MKCFNKKPFPKILILDACNWKHFPKVFFGFFFAFVMS